MSSAAKPVNQPDALRLLLDRIPRGGDATLIAEGDAADVLLELAADCLSGRRTRVLRAAEVLPGRPAEPLARAAGQAPGVPDDALSRSFKALTVLDPGCDRIVLLVGDAHTLKPSVLRYIQFASRSAGHLQLVFCGTRAFLDTLNGAEFAWLRARLKGGLTLALAAPIPEEEEETEEDAPPPSVPDEPAAWTREAAVPLSLAERPAVSATRRSWPLRLGVLALLGLGGTASLVLGVRGAAGDRPAPGRQAVFAVQPTVPPDAPAPGVRLTGNAPRPDAGAAPAAPDAASPRRPAIAGDAPGADPAPPSSVPVTPPPAKAPGPLVTVRQPPRTAVPDGPRPAEPPPSLVRSLGRPGVAAASSRAAAVALESRLRRIREARNEPTPAPDDQWTPPEPAFGSWTAPASPPPTRYIGSYATDANGVRTFRPEP